MIFANFPGKPSEMFNPTRDEVRHFFCETWRKYGSKTVMSPIEAMALEAIVAHPEYHAVLDDPDSAERLEDNPFLHLSLHLAVAEQLSIDQPFGIRARYERLLEKTKSHHDALHAIMECLGEMVWIAQRNASPPDQEIYFNCMDRHIPK
jgi:hypothetical protein